MNERIKELAITGGIYDCICDPYDKLKNGDPYSSVMVDLERFAEKIVRECSAIVEAQKESLCDDENAWSDRDYGYEQAVNDSVDMIKQHFGVEE